MRRFLRCVFFVCAHVALFAADTDPLAHLAPMHPRLLATDADFARLREAAARDPLQAELQARIIAVAEASLNASPIEHRLIGPRLLDQSRRAIARIVTRAMAYRLTGDGKYADAAKREMTTAARFADWNPSHFLDVAEMSFAMAIGYDWLYDQLTPDERAEFKKALLEKSLVFAPMAYAVGGPTDKRVAWVNYHHNWNQVCNGGLLAAALALADEEPDLARTVLAGVRASLPRATQAYAPDGAYPEGPSYWSYGTSYHVFILALLNSALGQNFGLGDDPAFQRTALYRLAIQAPSGQSFNYADGGAGMEIAPAYTWLAQHFAQPVALAHSRRLLSDHLRHSAAKNENDRFFALHALWFPAEAPVSTKDLPPLDQHFRGAADLALFRSAWNSPAALFLGFKAGDNAANHSHLDLGSFVLEADGVRWALDLGPDNYNLPGYFDPRQGGKRWTYFRLNNFSHNTLTPGDVLQQAKGVAPIVAFTSTPERASAVADLTTAYPDQAKRFRRGVALLDRTRVLVQDEIDAPLHAQTWHWRFATTAAVELQGREAVLTLGGHTLHVRILEGFGEATFAVAPALPTSPDENQNAGVRLLTLSGELPPDRDARLAVLLTPGNEAATAGSAAPTILPLDRW